MIPSTLLSIELTDELMARFDPRLIEMADQISESDGGHEVMWDLEADRWHLAPLIQTEINKFSGCYEARTNRVLEFDDPWDASLVFVRPDRLPGARLVAGKLEKKRCPRCDQPYTVPPSPPSFTITLPAPLLVPGLFTDEDQNLDIVSEDVLERLAQAGLDRGLEPLPLSIEGRADRAYFALHAPTMLYEAQPWGSTVPNRPCHVCGRRSAAHLFFPLFERPSAPRLASQDWFHELLLGPTAPVITKRVADWMRGEGKEWVSKPMYGRAPYFVRCGWDPDDRLIASMPERFQGTSVEPVEPLRPDEYPLPWPPPKKRGRKTKAT